MNSKYRAIPTTIDGIRFASKREAYYYSQLKLMQRAGEVIYFRPQPKFKIDIEGFHICNYFADFEVMLKSGIVEFWDVKGVLTPVYKLKKKLVKAIYNIDIVEKK